MLLSCEEGKAYLYYSITFSVEWLSFEVFFLGFFSNTFWTFQVYNRFHKDSGLDRKNATAVSHSIGLRNDERAEKRKEVYTLNLAFYFSFSITVIGILNIRVYSPVGTLT